MWILVATTSRIDHRRKRPVVITPALHEREGPPGGLDELVVAREIVAFQQGWDAAGDAQGQEALRLPHTVDIIGDGAIERVVGKLRKSGPAALAAAKRLIRDLGGRPIDAALIDDTAERIALLRATSEAREGVGAFLEKRPPAWLS